MTKNQPPYSTRRATLKKVLIVLLLPALIMAACAPPTSKGLGSPTGKKSDVRKQFLDVKSRRYQMDNQEIALRQEIAKIEEAQVQHLLTMTLPLETLFEPESSVLKPDAYDKLFVITRILRNHTETNAIIAVQADRSPRHRENLKAAEQWAAIVKNVLVGQGIDPVRLLSMGYGKTVLTTGKNAKGIHRRVQIILVPH